MTTVTRDIWLPAAHLPYTLYGTIQLPKKYDTNRNVTFTCQEEGGLSLLMTGDIAIPATDDPVPWFAEVGVDYFRLSLNAKWKVNMDNVDWTKEAVNMRISAPLGTTITGASDYTPEQERTANAAAERKKRDTQMIIFASVLAAIGIACIVYAII